MNWLCYIFFVCSKLNYIYVFFFKFFLFFFVVVVGRYRCHNESVVDLVCIVFIHVLFFFLFLRTIRCCCCCYSTLVLFSSAEILFVFFFFWIRLDGLIQPAMYAAITRSFFVSQKKSILTFRSFFSSFLFISQTQRQSTQNTRNIQKMRLCKHEIKKREAKQRTGITFLFRSLSLFLFYRVHKL